MDELLTKSEQDQIFELAAKLTGTCQEGRFRHQVIVTNVARRMHQVRCKSLAEYLEYASNHDEEYSHLISALTIHTTSWFRENPHYEKLEQELTVKSGEFRNRKLRVLSAACSTGEEVYSAALILEAARQRIEGFDYEIVGTDIDKVSVMKARRAIYDISATSQIPQKYHRFLLKGTGATEGFITFIKEIRERCKFSRGDLKNLQNNGGDAYNIIVCRNVLIYFSPEDVDRIVRNLLSMLSPAGVLCLGHSEALEPAKYTVTSLGNACYSRAPVVKAKTAADGFRAANASGEARALVVDDSATVRTSLTKLMSGSSFKVTAVESAEEATKFLRDNQVDIITLDLHMPGEDGKTWLEKQRRNGMRVPVVILSGASPSEALDVLGALENGAQDYIDKSALQKSGPDVIERIRHISHQYRQQTSGPAKKREAHENEITIQKPDLILIGASTGGTEVLSRMLKEMPRNIPPLMVVQHITPSFAAPFAKRLASISGLSLAEMKHGALLEPGSLYMALDDHHVGVAEKGGKLSLIVSNDSPINRHRPSVDFLFKNAALLSNKKILAMILTGMGADGARGLLTLRQTGAMTMAQDEQSCVVFGMPKEAIKLGGAQYVGNPTDLRQQLLKAINCPELKAKGTSPRALAPRAS